MKKLNYLIIYKPNNQFNGIRLNTTKQLEQALKKFMKGDNKND